jgi:alpha-ketoglutarate-dependent taurine dioxygenase
MPESLTSMHPFDLSDDAGYQRWRETKLSDYTCTTAAPVVQINDASELASHEYEEIMARCRKSNMAIYQVAAGTDTDKQAIRAFGRQFGLEKLDMNLRADDDSITSLRVVEAGTGAHYIPYTNRPLNWHTDGYYNRLDEQVRGIVMHCVSTSASGGDNLFLDPEIAYLLLRDENPDFITALMQPDAMTIPANIEDNVEARDSGALHMRYTARTRSIEWKDDRNTGLAVGFLSELLASDSLYINRHRLQAGQGIICNNVLHKREAFADDAAAGQQRMLYRARYHQRICGT